MNDIVELPKPTRKRLIQLSQLLKDWQGPKITSAAISAATGWKNTLIRHDLWLIGFNKGVSNGYSVDELRRAINLVLGIELQDSETLQKASNVAYVSNTGFQTVGQNFRNVCIVGLGRLGASLLDENLTQNSPFIIKAGFDSNVNRVEILRSTFPLYPASEMEWTLKREKIEYAILTVQDGAAQQMCNRLVKAGIKGIVNMTNVVLTVPDSVKVENISIMNALKLVI